MKLRDIGIITVSAGILIAYLNFRFFVDNRSVFMMLNMVAAFVAAGIPLIVRYDHYNTIKKIESIFPRFLTDVNKNINTGMTLPQAIRTVSKGDYGILTPHVREMNAKISWGVSFEKALIEFSKKIGSKSLKRTIWTIIEAHRSGGTISTVLEAVAGSLKELEKIKKERSSSVYSQLVSGYLIYLVFVGVMIGLSSFLVTSFDWQNQSSFSSMFTDLFRNLAIIQGIFAGLAIGKMSEGTLLAGIKHSLILTTIGVSAFLLLAG